MARTCLDHASPTNMVAFKDQTFVVDHAGVSVPVPGLSGWQCPACDEVVFDPDSARRYAETGDTLMLRERVRQRELL